MTGWHRGPLVPFDTESTGTSVEDDRIVTSCIAVIDGTGKAKPDSVDILIDPGIPIPKGASDIHGWTNDRLAADPRTVPARAGVEAIASMLAAALTPPTGETPILVAHNLPFDLTLLDRECRRHGRPTLTDRLAGRPLYAVDTYVLSKRIHPQRRGKGQHTLKTCALVWKLGWDDAAAHSADYDALMAARLAWAMAHKFPKLAEMSLPDLMALQAREKQKQDADLAGYFRSVGKEFDGLTGDWPMVPFGAGVQQAIG